MLIHNLYDCSVAFFDKDKNLLGQFPVKEGSDHADRLMVAVNNGILNFDFYILPHSIGYAPTVKGFQYYHGMKREGESWIMVNPDTFEIMEEIKIPGLPSFKP